MAAARLAQDQARDASRHAGTEGERACKHEEFD
jgi:hypothetical protein